MTELMDDNGVVSQTVNELSELKFKVGIIQIRLHLTKNVSKYADPETKRRFKNPKFFDQAVESIFKAHRQARNQSNEHDILNN